MARVIEDNLSPFRRATNEEQRADTTIHTRTYKTNNSTDFTPTGGVQE
jgi:hypothetical protein